MTDLDIFLTGFTGGAIAAVGIAMALYAQIKFVYDEKLKSLQMQLVAIRAELNKSYDECLK